MQKESILLEIISDMVIRKAFGVLRSCLSHHQGGHAAAQSLTKQLIQRSSQPLKRFWVGSTAPFSKGGGMAARTPKNVML